MMSIHRTLSQHKASTSSGAKKAENPDKSMYKAPEYYGHNEYTYYDMEREMAKSRLPQPSSLPKIDYTWSQLPPKEHMKKN